MRSTVLARLVAAVVLVVSAACSGDESVGSVNADPTGDAGGTAATDRPAATCTASLEITGGLQVSDPEIPTQARPGAGGPEPVPVVEYEINAGDGVFVYLDAYDDHGALIVNGPDTAWTNDDVAGIASDGAGADVEVEAASIDDGVDPINVVARVSC